jgi:hypothetical protein
MSFALLLIIFKLEEVLQFEVMPFGKFCRLNVLFWFRQIASVPSILILVIVHELAMTF